MSHPRHSEAAFETVIEAHLLAHGYVAVDRGSFDRQRAFFPDTVLAFIRATQPKEWARLEALHGEKTGAQILSDLCKWMDSHGALATLRHGFKCYGRTLHAAYFKAAHQLNPELEARYAANCLGLTRQLHFSPRSEQSLDITLSLNGIPIATLELKNPLTGQTVAEARQQYQRDRDPRLPIFAFQQRTLVHFAVDTEAVFMTTRLAGPATHFLPFNQGCDGGAGNPPDPAGRTYRTAYLWEEVLQRDSLLDLLARFVHLQSEEKRDDQGRKVQKETMIFPRYHQLQAVRYKQSFDRYIRHKGYAIKSLVAFSGTVQDDRLADVTFTEEGMNQGIRAKELPEHFATPEYQVLLVAEKYQTGFDQPLLHTMYVDKRLAGIQAVQTLSRLNRMHPLKEDTFVLDFVNDRDDIRAAFKTYFDGAEMGEEVDPARMYQLQGELDASGVYLAAEVARFCAVYFKPKPRQSALDHQAMHAALDPAVARFTVLQHEQEAEAELWRGKVQGLCNLYGFLSQVIPYQDSDLERLYVFLRYLATRLPRRRHASAYQFDDEVRLEYYRLQKSSEASILLQNGDAPPLDGPTEVGSGLVRTQPVPLSQLIDLVNERFGTDFNQADQLFFDQLVAAAMADDRLRQAAAVNPGDKFALVFQHVIENLFVERMDQNEEIFVRFMNDLPFQKVVTAWLASEAYRRLRGGTDEEGTAATSTNLQPQPRIVQPRPEERYVTCVPIVPLQAAAGVFSDPQHVGDDHWEWVAVTPKRRLRPGMFVAQVIGKSMQPTIPDGSYCLFRAPVVGTRQGKIVPVQLRDALDPDSGERYTVKRYLSEKVEADDSWRHVRITLKPINPDFQPIEITDEEGGEFQVVAEFLEVLGGVL